LRPNYNISYAVYWLCREAGGSKIVEEVDESRVNEVRSTCLPSVSSLTTHSCLSQVLEDPELRSMLLDPNLQQILAECNDPVKFQQHMRNPEIARKIHKLFQAGLVGTAK
jgi:hypothetical protein